MGNDFVIGLLTLMVVCGGGIALHIWLSRRQQARDLRQLRIETANMTPEEKFRYLENRRLQVENRRLQEKAQQEEGRLDMVYGLRNAAIKCPHCEEKGRVRTRLITQKKGISGAKATGALLTGGLSILATGLSRKEASTQAHCDNCNITWVF